MIKGTTADITVHIDEDLDPPHRDGMEAGLMAMDGVLSVHMGEGPAAHLVVVGFDPELARTEDLLTAVEGQGVHASLIGF